MADKKISQLTSLAPALSTDELPINRSNASGKLTVADVVAGEAATRASKDGDLTTLTTTANSNLVSAINEVNSGLATKIPTSYLDTDTSLTANSDSKIATQKATRAYVLANVTPSATETVQGKAEIATQAETNTGTDDTRFITPLKLKTNLTSLNYLGGTGTANFIPKYSASNTLANSAIQQSATGNRILVNGVTDDLASTLQVNGSIRQTAITSKIAALDANGKIIDGGSGTLNYLTKFSAANTLTQSIIRDDSSTVAIGSAPLGYAKFGVTNSTSGISTYSANTYVEPTPSLGQESFGSYHTITGANIWYNVGGYFNATGASSGNYSVKLNDGTEGNGKFLKSVTADGKANWANITINDITTCYTASTTLRVVDILALGTTPITLVAAPGANKSIWVKRVYARINYSSTTYTSQVLVLKINGASTANNVAQESLILSSTATRYSKFLIQEDSLSLANDTFIVDNGALIITTASGANPTTGNSTIDIYVEYSILDFNDIF